MTEELPHQEFQQPVDAAIATELTRRAEQLYDVFSRYPARPGMPHCNHGMNAEEIHGLCERPLRGLNQSQLHRYIWHAPEVIGEVVDFKHFLPRIIEAFFLEDSEIGLEVLCGKFAECDWTKWPLPEQEAVVAFLKAWWRWTLAQYPSPNEIDGILCGLACVFDDLNPFLTEWRETQADSALGHLADFATTSAQMILMGGLLPSPWWDERPDQLAQAFWWLMDPATNRALEQAFSHHADQPLGEAASKALQQLEYAQEEIRGRSG